MKLHERIDRKAAVDVKGGALTATITDGTLDRDNEVVDPAGVDTRAFLANPVLLWAHDMTVPPIGKLALAQSGERIVASITFADTAFAKEIKSLYEGGFLNAFSIGFIPRQYERMDDPDGAFLGHKITACELVEVSAVPVPANPSALMERIKGLDDGTRALICKGLTPALAEDDDGAPWDDAESDDAGDDDPEAEDDDGAPSDATPPVAPKAAAPVAPAAQAAPAPDVTEAVKAAVTALFAPMQAEIVRLSKTVSGMRPLAPNGAEPVESVDGEPSFMAMTRDVVAEKGCSLGDAMALVARKRPDLHRAFLARRS